MTVTSSPVPDVIIPVQFAKKMRRLLENFSCGTTESAEQAMSWILGDGYPSVLNEMNRGTRVWLYRNPKGQWVGFGSLGTTVWMLQGIRTELQLMPMLGVFAEHQGHPKPESGDAKYCYQIVDHLIDEAE
jgi:hypothetical protein